MTLTRRQFMVAGAGAIAVAGAGCERAKDWPTEARRWLGQPTAPPLPAALAPSESTEIDPVSHAINRLTFGARPGDYRRVATMGVEAFIEEQLAPAKIEDWLCARLIRHETIIGRVINASKRQGGPQVVPFGGMVVHHIKNHFDSRAV